METAILENDIDTVKYLLQNGFDPNYKNSAGTPLIFLTEKPEILEILLSHGADSKCPDQYNFTLEDYCEDEAILNLLKKPRNVIIASKSKVIKYKETLRLKKKRTKTLKNIKSSEQSC
jgi:ankyrin repeat protein